MTVLDAGTFGRGVVFCRDTIYNEEPFGTDLILIVPKGLLFSDFLPRSAWETIGKPVYFFPGIPYNKGDPAPFGGISPEVIHIDGTFQNS